MFRRFGVPLRFPREAKRWKKDQARIKEDDKRVQCAFAKSPTVHFAFFSRVSHFISNVSSDLLGSVDGLFAIARFGGASS